jgi:hypothetical protein
MDGMGTPFIYSFWSPTRLLLHSSTPRNFQSGSANALKSTKYKGFSERCPNEVCSWIEIAKHAVGTLGLISAGMVKCDSLASCIPRLKADVTWHVLSRWLSLRTTDFLFSLSRGLFAGHESAS